MMLRTVIVDKKTRTETKQPTKRKKCLMKSDDRHIRNVDLNFDKKSSTHPHFFSQTLICLIR